MALKDLIATPGEIAASRITRSFDFSSHDAHERLFADVARAVDGAVAAEREAIARDLMDAGWEEAADYVIGVPPQLM